MTYSVAAIRLFISRCLYSTLVPMSLLIAGCGLASAEAPKAKPLPCGLTDEEIAGLSGDAGTDVHAVPNFSKTVYSLLQAGKFESLDCLADSARAHKETFPGGMWKIHAIYSRLTRPPLHPTQEDWETHLELLQQWVSTRSESITARVALAQFYVNYGADARGPGFADTVSESGWKLLAERVAKAKQILDDASTLATKDPEWYVVMQNVASYESWEPAATLALLEQAVKFEPGYYYYYRLYAESVLPKWGGQEGETERFLQKAADRLGGNDGDILYFRVAGYLVCGCPGDQQLKLSWPRILKGFDAVEEQNGPAPENWNLLAHMALSFNDPVAADKQLTRIGDQWSEDIWQTSSAFESAKQWAKQMMAIINRKRPAEQAAKENLQTVDGQRYDAAFAEKIRTWLQPCIDQAAGADMGNFELLIMVGKDGTIEDLTGGGHSPLMPCLGHKLNGFRVGKEAVFPPPPKPAWWVRFDFNAEEPASAALK